MNPERLRRTEIFVLDGLAWFSFRFDHVVSLLRKILDKHFLGIQLDVADRQRQRSPTVAIAITKVALLEHCTMSSSSWMIFLIRETVANQSVQKNSIT